MAVMVMGVSGVGKTAVGRALAAATGVEFVDADDFHPAPNVAKMSRGEPLTDADRADWLARLNGELRARMDTGRSTVLACSALKARYRAALLAGVTPPPRVVFLHADYDAVAVRLAHRRGHFMPATLLASQFEALEPPTDAVVIDASRPLDEVVAAAVSALAMPREAG
jgi:gluconokinase